jgi:CDP-glycerol glycerophosphotransferase (TagB/SpsB family)
MASNSTTSSDAANRYNDFLFKVQQDLTPNSNELFKRINKERSERNRILKKRRTAREKVEKALKDVKLSELELEDNEKRTKDLESQYQTALMKEAQKDNLM